MCDNHTPLSKKILKRLGSSIEHGEAHENDHRKWSRRDFLTNTGLFSVGTAMMLGKLPVSAFTPSPLMRALSNSECGDRILLLIRMDGGNDGLNMVVPKTNDKYYNIRPTIAIQPADTWALSTDFGMPTVMSDLEPFWNDGNMKVIHNVGYPNQNYSHFRSADIWASSSAEDVVVNTGWIGRLLENEFNAFQDAPPVVPPALQIGIQTNMVFRGAMANMALAISNPTEFYQIASTGQLYNTASGSGQPREVELAFVRTVANSAYRYSETIRNAYNNGSNQVTYADDYLAEQMSIVARLIKGNLGTKVYMVSIGGFDTHADQLDRQPELLNRLASAVAAFYNDLEAAGWGDKVVAMTFSEFGRTIFENGSVGTDHGTGAPMLIFGKGIGNGFHGNPPDLYSVNQYGDPVYDVDFRSVYATILQDWLCVEPNLVDYVIGSQVNPISNIVPAGTAPIGANETAALLGHNPSQQVSGAIEIKYAMLRRGNVRLLITDSAGHILRTLVNTFQEKDSYTFQFKPSDYYLPAGEYIYRLDTGGKSYWRDIKW